MSVSLAAVSVRNHGIEQRREDENHISELNSSSEN
jgi:hypothetical protein